MILQVESNSPRPMDVAEVERRHLSLLNCLKRMGFYDPAALIASSISGSGSVRDAQYVDTRSGGRTRVSQP